jgi:hypothetical protein
MSQRAYEWPPGTSSILVRQHIKIHNLEKDQVNTQSKTLYDKRSIKKENSPLQVVKMHSKPIPVIVKFLRIENKITILKNRKGVQKGA